MFHSIGSVSMPRSQTHNNIESLALSLSLSVSVCLCLSGSLSLCLCLGHFVSVSYTYVMSFRREVVQDYLHEIYFLPDHPELKDIHTVLQDYKKVRHSDGQSVE